MAAKSHWVHSMGQLLLPPHCPWEMTFSDGFPPLISREAGACLLWPPMASSLTWRCWIRWLLHGFHTLILRVSLLFSVYQKHSHRVLSLTVFRLEVKECRMSLHIFGHRFNNLPYVFQGGRVSKVFPHNGSAYRHLVMRDLESEEIYVLSIYFLPDPVLGGIKNC